MNANELAKLLEVDSWYKLVTREEVATMLRQQQADYYSLLVNHDKLYAKVLEQQAEIEALKKEAALQRLSDFTQEAEKTLTDEEIIETYTEIDGRGIIEFARAILRKAQEE